MLTNDEIDKLVREAMELPLDIVITNVSFTLTPKIAAFMCGKNDVLVLGAWVFNEELPTRVEKLRLRYGYIASEILKRNYGVDTARAGFLGKNSYLGDEAPASWLRNHEKEKDLKEVVSAAKCFGEMGT